MIYDTDPTLAPDICSLSNSCLVQKQSLNILVPSCFWGEGILHKNCNLVKTHTLEKNKTQLRNMQEEMFSDKAIPLSSSLPASDLSLPTLVPLFGGSSFFPRCFLRVATFSLCLSLCCGDTGGYIFKCYVQSCCFFFPLIQLTKHLSDSTQLAAHLDPLLCCTLTGVTMAYVNPSLTGHKTSATVDARQREYLLDMIPSRSSISQTANTWK